MVVILSRTVNYNLSKLRVRSQLLCNNRYYRSLNRNQYKCLAMRSYNVILLSFFHLQDVYLHTNCLAILANMAPHVHRLSAYAAQKLLSLFDILSRKYAIFITTCFWNPMNRLERFSFAKNELLWKHIVIALICCICLWRYTKLAEANNKKIHTTENNPPEGKDLVEDTVIFLNQTSCWFC